VVFDEADLEFAADVFHRFPTWPRFLSCGTGSQEHEGLNETASRYRWLCDAVKGDSRFANVSTFPQLHVIAWGHEKGV